MTGCSPVAVDCYYGRHAQSMTGCSPAVVDCYYGRQAQSMTGCSPAAVDCYYGRQAQFMTGCSPVAVDCYYGRHAQSYDWLFTCSCWLLLWQVCTVYDWLFTCSRVDCSAPLSAWSVSANDVDACVACLARQWCSHSSVRLSVAAGMRTNTSLHCYSNLGFLHSMVSSISYSKS